MNSNDITNLLSPEVLIYVIPSALVCVGIGIILGREIALRNLSERMRKQQKQLVDTLQTMLQSTEQMSSDVGSHGTELETMGKSVNGISAEGDLEEVQYALLEQITAMVHSNRKMEDDLVMTHFRLEEQAQELDRTRLEARTDQLSGLANRKAFDEFLQFAISQHNRKGTPFALLLADVDHFKRINDTHGHQAGDRVVEKLGEALRHLTRDHDHVSRFGGDEFALVLVGVDSVNAPRAAARIRAAIENTNFDVGEDGGRIAVTLSLGMSFPKSNDSKAAIYKRADKALYRSKEAGRNQLHVWNPAREDAQGSEDSHTEDRDVVTA